MTRSLFIAITVFFFVISFYIGNKTKYDIQKYQRYKTAYTSELNFENHLLDVSSYLHSDSWNKSKKQGIELRKKYLNAKSTALKYSWTESVIIALYLLVFSIFYIRKKMSSKQFGLVILNSSLVLLFLGINLPFIDLGAFMKDISPGGIKTFDGKMYFFYQCKSVIDLIATLFQKNNAFVGIIILLFSVLNPLTKLILYYIYLFSDKMNQKQKLLKTISFIGKYSMADVFVASCFLAFLSFQNINTGIKTESTTLIGLYFFFGYCILSIASFYFIEKKTEINEKSKVISSLDEKF